MGDKNKKESVMRVLKNLAIAIVAVGTVAVGATAADARPWHRHHHHHGGGWVGPAIIGGLALGAVAATAPGYSYYGGACERQVVGYRPSGRPIVRTVCY
jgi:hypothetical protein